MRKTIKENKRTNNVIHNLYLEWITILAVTVNVIIFVVTAWSEDIAIRDLSIGNIIIWALSLVWLVVFVYANVFYRNK